jgi:hypothetical protein
LLLALRHLAIEMKRSDRTPDSSEGVRGDHAALASYLRIEEREFEAGGAN